MLNKSVRIGKSKIHGKGLVAVSILKKNEVVHKMEKGEFSKVDIKELHSWPKKKINDFLHYAFQGGKTFYYGMKKNDSSFFMNHSCDPNCWYKGGNSIIARRNILAGEELTIDYAMVMSPFGLEKPFSCRCGDKSCRKEISKFDCLDQIVHRKYKGHFLPFIEGNFKNLKKIAH